MRICGKGSQLWQGKGCCCSVMPDSVTPWTAAHQAPGPSPSLGVCSNSCPLSWWCYPVILSSDIPFSSCLQFSPASGSFQIESVIRIRWPKYWSFSFSISPSSEYSGLISFRMDWLDLLAVQGTLKSLLSSKASILWDSAARVKPWWIQRIWSGDKVRVQGRTI